MKTLNETTDWGYYVAQVDESADTLTLMGEFGFTSPPGLVQIPCVLDKPFGLSRAMGSANILGWADDGNASFVASIFDNAGRTIAVVKASALGKSSVLIPVNVQQRVEREITALTLQFYVDLPGAQTFNWSLVLT